MLPTSSTYDAELEEDSNLSPAQAQRDCADCQWLSPNNQTIPDWWCPSDSLGPWDSSNNPRAYEDFVHSQDLCGSTLWTDDSWDIPTWIPNYGDFPVAGLMLGENAATHSIPTIFNGSYGNKIGEGDFVVQDHLPEHGSQSLIQHLPLGFSGLSGSSDDAFHSQPESSYTQSHLPDAYTTATLNADSRNAPWNPHNTSHLAEENDGGVGTSNNDHWGFYPTICDFTTDYGALTFGYRPPLDSGEGSGPQSAAREPISRSELCASSREDSEPSKQLRPRATVPTYTLCPQPTLLPDIREGLRMSSPGGTLDQYIHALREVMNRFDGAGQLTPKLRQEMIATGVLWIVREAWPQAERFWKLTASFQGFCQAETWRNFPEPTVYRSMHPSYRPTPTQLLIPHSPLIDWLPWPDLRDKIISSQGLLDVELVCKTAIQNVVAHRRTDLRPGQQQQQQQQQPPSSGESIAATPTSTNKTSFRVWDLCALEEEAGPWPAERPALECRPRTAPVKALVKAYSLECDDFQTQKLHPDFFDVFPHLHVDSVISDYTIRELPILTKSSEKDALGLPRQISQASMKRSETLETRLLQAILGNNNKPRRL